jgi:hypothetical protein
VNYSELKRKGLTFGANFAKKKLAMLNSASFPSSRSAAKFYRDSRKKERCSVIQLFLFFRKHWKR